MKIPKSLLRVCSTDQTRISVQHIYADVEKKLAIATNGAILAAVPIEPEEGEESGYLSSEAVQQAHKWPKKSPLLGVVYHTSLETRTGPHVFANPIKLDNDIKFPNWESVVVDEKEYREPTTQLCFNAEYMAIIGKVLQEVLGGGGPSRVTLLFDKKTSGSGRPIRVSAPGAPKGVVCLVMPCRV